MITTICLIIGVLILARAGDLSGFDYFVIFVIIMVSAGFLLDIERSKKLKPVKLPLIIGYFARLFLLFYDVYSSDPLHLPLVGGPMTEDPLRFFTVASILADGGTSSYGGAFARVFGVIFKVTAPSRLWGEFIVMLFSILTLITIAKIVMNLEVSTRDKSLSMYLACLMPNYILLSVVFRRETVITFFVAMSLLFFLQWFNGADSEKPFILAVFFGLLASLFHGATGIIAVFYLVFHFVYSPNDKKFNLSLRNIILVFAFSVLFFFFYARYGTVFFSKLERLSGNIESLSSVRDAGDMSYARYVGNSNSLLNILIYSIPRYAYFMYSPFPWQWRGLNDILTFLMSSVPYLVILVRAIRTIRKYPKSSHKRTMIIIIVFIAVGMTFIFSWGVTNTGTATRHRDKFLALYTVLFALSHENRIRFKIRNR